MLTFADEMRALELAVAAEAARRAEALANSQRDAISLARRQGLLDAISQHGPLTARQCAEATGFSKDSTLHHSTP
ncbi:hypothetical protein [Propionivibrio sp.]|uniref:hypothetical protein n=1 Tax=Propionivibrio sp. TaxID=2212460 RepID=UPI0039E70CAA